MPTVMLPGGSRIWYSSAGTGPRIVQIHGSAFGHRNFERLSPLLVDRLEVIDFDLPGFGESEPAAHGGGIHNWADDVAAFIRLLGEGPVHVHGTSLGAMIGLSLAARHPDVVDHVVLSCFLCRYDRAALVMRSTWVAAARAIGMSAVADLTAVAGFSREFFERADAREELERMREAFSVNDPATFVRATESLFDLDLTPLLPDVTAPLLLIGGEEDYMTPVDPAPTGFGLRRLSEQVANSRLAVVPGSGHYMVIEAPKQTAALIVEFILRGE